MLSPDATRCKNQGYNDATIWSHIVRRCTHCTALDWRPDCGGRAVIVADKPSRSVWSSRTRDVAQRVESPNATNLLLALRSTRILRYRRLVRQFPSTDVFGSHRQLTAVNESRGIQVDFGSFDGLPIYAPVSRFPIGWILGFFTKAKMWLDVTANVPKAPAKKASAKRKLERRYVEHAGDKDGNCGHEENERRFMWWFAGTDEQQRVGRS